MIVDMIKYDFLLYHNDYEAFLKSLQELGLVDVARRGWIPTDGERVLLSAIADYKSAIEHLKKVKVKGQAYSAAEEALAAYKAANHRLEEIDAERRKLNKEIDDLRPWGDFSAENVARLRQNGVILRFFAVPTKQYDAAWEDEYAITPISESMGTTYFVVATTGQRVEISAVEVKAPTASYTDKEASLVKLQADEDTENKDISNAAASIEMLKIRMQDLREQLDFSCATEAGERHADGTLVILEGWVPAENSEAVRQFAENEGVIFTSEKPKLTDDPPIKLKNSFFARLYEPIGSLYMLPRYNEIDMTPFFAPFFMLFFGFCFADAGYGLMFMIAIGVMWHKIPKQYRDFAWLGLFLNFAAVIFGLLTGNVFGIELVKIDALESVKKYILNPNDTFNLAIMVGGAQVLFGQILRVFNRIKRGGAFIYGLSQIGWVLLMISSILAFTDLIPGYGSESTPFYVTLGIAGVLIFLFNSPGKNPFINIGSGLYGTYEMATGLLGDLLSYIRLFAIGLAGSVIGQVFNELAFGLSGDIPVLKQLVVLVILVIGHGLNIFVGLLGSFVHPLRLTFVEFFKNSEFDGGGRRFAPFKKVSK